MPATSAIFTLLEASAARDPRAPALVGLNASISYGAMLAQIRRTARAIDAVVPAAGAIATILPHTPHGVAATLGALASGRTCIVLAAGDPPERTLRILADAQPAAVLLDGESDRTSSSIAGARTLYFQDAFAAHAPDDWRPEPRLADDAPAVVHYTSGSTGAPRGIALPLDAVLYRARSCNEMLALGPGKALMTVSNAAASSGFSFILAATLTGARLALADLGREGAGPFLRLATAERPDAFVAPAPTLRMLVRLPQAAAAFANVRIMRIGAAGLPTADLIAFRAMLPRDCAIDHTYASTEANVIAEWIVPPDACLDEAAVPIGWPRAPHELALLDANDVEVAPGEVGELVVTSPVISLGEWQGGRLVPGRMRPAHGRPGWRVFRTGDLIRRGQDGLLRFVARADRQIKINGRRIEPGEIEAALRRCPGVTDAIVAPDGNGGGPPLAAFVAAPAKLHAGLMAELRTSLRAALPRGLQHVPITLVTAFPETRHGKIDLASLRASPRVQQKEGAA
ncbi:MAG TPA: AMP-binding protein [Acetobacteraceae bacterium]|nr:AMP-binding protein [Acetobacteraceae bacterium]